MRTVYIRSDGMPIGTNIFNEDGGLLTNIKSIEFTDLNAYKHKLWRATLHFNDNRFGIPQPSELVYVKTYDCLSSKQKEFIEFGLVGAL